MRIVACVYNMMDGVMGGVHQYVHNLRVLRLYYLPTVKEDLKTLKIKNKTGIPQRLFRRV